jgi:hypothetical protein
MSYASPSGWPRLALLLALLALLLAGRATRAQTTTFTFSAPVGDPQTVTTYTEPAGATQLVVVAAGGGSIGWNGGGMSGAVVQATLPVTPGETLTVVLGQVANPAGPNSAFATELRRATPSTGDYLTSRNAMLVAGASGASGYGGAQGGNGGTPNGPNRPLPTCTAGFSFGTATRLPTWPACALLSAYCFIV